MQLVEQYLNHRGLSCERWPDNLAYHPNVYNFTTNKRHPAMLCAFQSSDDAVVAVHQTFLAEDGHKIRGKEVKSKLVMGPMKGAAIRLTPTQERVALTEGIEDALSIMQLTDWPCWATGSASNIPVLPVSITDILLCPDNDEAGSRWAARAIRLYQQQGRQVDIYRMPEGIKDANELLQQ